MASENETVEDIVREMHTATVIFGPGDAAQSMTRMEKKLLRVYADRIESAWRRDKAQVMQAATEVAMAPTQVQYEPRPKRNFDRFASYGDALDAHRRECCDYVLSLGEKRWYCKAGMPSFGAWLFAPVAEGGES